MANNVNENTADKKVTIGRRRRRQATGVVAMLLCVIGIGTVIYGAFTGVSKMFDQSGQKAEYEELLSPLVMLDPLEFDSLEAADQNTLMQAAIWACFYGEADLSVYDRDEYGALILPSVDIDKYAARLYGPNFQIIHDTFQDDGMEFLYDETTACYTIPITGQVGSYQTQVVEVKGLSEKVITVAYMAPAAGGALDLTGTTTDTPMKYMEYVFTRENGEYYLTALRESDMRVPASPPAQQQDTPAQMEEENSVYKTEGPDETLEG